MEGLLLLFCLAVAAYSFRPRRPRTAPPEGARVARVRAPRRSRGAPGAPWPVIIASLLARDAARLRLTLVRAWRAMATAYQLEMARRAQQPVLSSAPLLTDTATTTQPAPQPQKRETRNETGTETDIKLGQKRVTGVVALAAAGMDEAQIWAVVQKEPAALVVALKLTAARNVAAVMEGATAANMDVIRAIRDERLSEVAE